MSSPISADDSPFSIQRSLKTRLELGYSVTKDHRGRYAVTSVLMFVKRDICSMVVTAERAPTKSPVSRKTSAIVKVVIILNDNIYTNTRAESKSLSFHPMQPSMPRKTKTRACWMHHAVQNHLQKTKSSTSRKKKRRIFHLPSVREETTPRRKWSRTRNQPCRGKRRTRSLRYNPSHSSATQ